MAEREAAQVRIEMAPKQAYEFLRRLASDRDLRENLQANPAEVLHERGIHVPEEYVQVPAVLPPERALQELADWAERWEKYGIMTVIAPCSLAYRPICIRVPQDTEGDPGPEGGSLAE